ncbi:MAG TPA: hypothetical protein VFR70_03350 [Flavobacterium sp.]|nr:hypothetical protein [Flavobacterium sp.]
MHDVAVLVIGRGLVIGARGLPRFLVERHAEPIIGIAVASPGAAAQRPPEGLRDVSVEKSRT